MAKSNVVWTLVISLVFLNQLVYARPSKATSSLPNNDEEKSTDSSTRYKYSNSKLTNLFSRFANVEQWAKSLGDIFRHLSINRLPYGSDFVSFKGKVENSKRNPKEFSTSKITIENGLSGKKTLLKKPVIKKVLTKWTDNGKSQDFNFSFESFHDAVSSSTEQYSSTENHVDLYSSSGVAIHPNNEKHAVVIKNKLKYQPDFSSDNKIFSPNIQVLESFSSKRPIYIFTTPSPTPIITNIGNPSPWLNKIKQQISTSHKPTTVNLQQDHAIRPPLKNSHHNVFNTYIDPRPDSGNFEVSTFSPVNAYTEKIIIRPDEYSASSDDCPTIYLTLNNTFQGQAKEACPDLNIAVNTNVVNKNVLVESEEEETDLFPDGFGLPLGENSESEEAAQSDNTSSDEGKPYTDSASVEGAGFTNYNAAPNADADQAALPNSALASYSKPTKHKPNNDDDAFSLSSLIDFFRPAMNALGWLATISPLGFSIFSILLAPVAFLLVGTTGLTALFAPWALPYARESPQEIHIYRPQWQWDDEIKTWYLQSSNNDKKKIDLFDSKNWIYRYPRSSEEEIKSNPTWLYKVKKWMVDVTKNIMQSNVNQRNLPSITKYMPRLVKRLIEKMEKDAEIKLSTSQPRDIKTKVGPIGESIQMVASQLLENLNNTSDTPIVTDTRIPPKLKNQLPLKNKLKTRLEDSESKIENSHAGVAVPVSLEEIETENIVRNSTHESSTTQEGLSTWILLSNPTAKDHMASTEPTKVEEVTKKNKLNNKNKKKPSSDNKVPASKQPLIGSIHKSDLVAGGSALNDNVLNKIKDTVLSNVQKNKSTVSPKSTTETSVTSSTHANDLSFNKKEPIHKGTVIPVVKVSSKPSKKKSSTKTKPKTTTTTEATPISESAMLPMEPKEQEIELEISTPATTTKKPKRTSSKKKKNKTKKRKTTTTKPVSQTAIELKSSSNKTKSAKPAKTVESPITTQIYNYLSREVMPSVGVSVIGLAGLVGLASYFFYPFATPVRRTFEVDKKDDLYRHNGEEYANEGNGQAEEEMLGTVLAGMPAHSKNRLNPYMGQTTHGNVYSPKKEQDLRYRHAASNNYETPNYNVHYPQQKTGIAHGAVYADHNNYSPQHVKHDNRFVYTTEGKYAYEKSSYTPYPAVEPIYAAPSEATGISGYGSEVANSVVYGVKPSGESDFKPVYPFEGQVFSDTTSDPVTYPPTSMYLGSNNESEQDDEFKGNIENKSDRSNDVSDLNKFVVGNVPKDFVDTVTPAIVPEHGPRNLNRRKRFVKRIKRNIVENIEHFLKESKSNGKDVFLSNEIDEVLDIYDKKHTKTIEENDLIKPVEISQLLKNTSTLDNEINVINDGQVVESVSTLPVDMADKTKESVPLSEKLNEIYQPISESPQNNEANKKNPSMSDSTIPTQQEESELSEKSTEATKTITENKTDLVAVSTSTTQATTLRNSPEIKNPDELSSTLRPKPTNPNIITYPPISEEGSFFTFLRRLLDFKYRLGLSILQTTSDSLNRYLKNVGTAANNVTPSSRVRQ